MGYATSRDGMTWTKDKANPIFVPDPNNDWEKNRTTACQVIRLGDWYVMFYIGFRDPYTAQIGIARSKDGITAWQRHPANPVVRAGGKGEWDEHACCKPYAIYDGRKWLLWYNGRRMDLEQIGVATHEGKDYNHSTFCDLVISGLIGLRPRADNVIEVNPLLPEGTWDYFCLDRVLYHGRTITILHNSS